MLATFEAAAATVNADSTLELIEVLIGVYPHLPASELRRWTQLDVPSEVLLRLRGELAGITSPRADGFVQLSNGHQELSRQQVEMAKGYVGGVRVSRAMFMRNEALNKSPLVTFPRLLAQVYPMIWPEVVERVERRAIPPHALRSYEASFEELDEGTGYLSLERMKSAQAKFRESIAAGRSGIVHASNAFERHIHRTRFKHLCRWLIGDISVTVSFMKQVDRTRSGFVGLAELLRAAFPNVQCARIREHLQPGRTDEGTCRCDICSSTAGPKHNRPRPPNPYIDSKVQW